MGAERGCLVDRAACCEMSQEALLGLPTGWRLDRQGVMQTTCQDVGGRSLDFGAAFAPVGPGERTEL